MRARHFWRAINLCIVALWANIALPSITLSHQAKSSITQIELNHRSGNLEVSMRFLLHDAEHAIKHLMNKNTDILHSSKSQQLFVNYTQQQFEIAITPSSSESSSYSKAEHHPIPLQYVGYELDGKYIWVYLETPLQTINKAKRLSIRMHAFIELWPSQSNLVTISSANNHHSVNFTQGDNWLTITIPPAIASPTPQ